MIHRVTSLFPLWALLASATALQWPSFYVGLKSTIVPLLGLVMFGMGMTLTRENFAEVLKQPKHIVIGVSLQYLLMPLFAWIIGTFWDCRCRCWSDW